jgi:peptidoglycan/xylan/chitin deacetylase (PgdA/CDA1 family)
MIGQITVKRAINRLAGWAAVLSQPVVAGPRRRACILAYHRIADLDFVDPTYDDWNVPPNIFESQIRALCEVVEWVPLSGLLPRLAAPQTATKPLVCLTFDDGYASVCSRALPILRRYGVPATAFVVTSVIGSPEPMPFDGWSRTNRRRAPAEAWRPMTWHELETCMASGMITIGSHSHRHLNARECSAAQLREEVEEARAVIAQRLGADRARLYSYPYGSTALGFVPAPYVAAVRQAGYELAVTTNLGLASVDSDPYLLPRVQALGVDGPATIRAKVLGALAPYYLTEHLRRARRRV